MQHIMYLPVWLVEQLKRMFNVHTWQVEAVFVFVVLAGLALLSGKGWIEWVGVFAVLFTWNHASVANRMEEINRKQEEEQDEVHVHCYRWTTRYFYLKEVLWFIYFFALGAWSALAGVIIFLLYGPWRTLWRKYHPV